MGKRIFCLLFALGACGAVSAETQGDFEFTRVGPTGVEQRAVITGYSGGIYVSVPATLAGVRVNRIAENAFRGKAVRAVDINIPGLTIDNGAFADNPDIENIHIGNNANLAPQSFGRNFVSYYVTTRKKAGGTYRYSKEDSKWMTEDEWVVAQARLRRESVEEARKRAEAEEARRKAEETRRREEEARRREAEARRPAPAYTPSYSDFDFDLGFQFLYGVYLNAGYIDGFSVGYGLQLGFDIDLDDMQLNILGQGGLAFSIIRGVAYDWGGIGELVFDDDWGLGFGTGYADAFNIGGRQYFRGALIVGDGLIDGYEIYKVSFYADYFTNANWRCGISFLMSLK
jgi:hypothetical protein